MAQLRPRFRLLDTGPRPAAENMALDEVLTRLAGQGISPPTLRFLRFSPPAALVGHHQQPERELRIDYCKAHGIDISRRLTGGGAIYFQESALGWELIGPMGTWPFTGGFEAIIERICTAAARALSRLGIPAAFRPRNDIEVEGRKISGTGGIILEGGVLVQGTVLVVNELEKFLWALKVPVEKLKKREFESLAERIAFLEDLLGRPVPVHELIAILAEGLAEALGIELEPGGLTPEEEQELARREDYYASEEYIYGLRARPGPCWLRHIHPTDAGTVIVHLWLDTRGLRVANALITGDFFSHPQRLIMDLEAALKGRKAKPAALAGAVEEFFATTPGELVGISAEELAQAVAMAAARRELTKLFSEQEAAELWLVGLEPAELERTRARWLLLPYCSKPTSCPWRFKPGCGRCGECEFDELYALGEELGLKVYSIQSFEHLMEVLNALRGQQGVYVGSCCEPFYCKHQKEMAATGTKGVLVRLDCTTCYDLGKGMEAYAGKFENQTFMNTALMLKTARLLT